MNLEWHRSVNLDRLVDLYNRTSKHGQYQLLATPLRDRIPSGMLRVKSRYEPERLEYILRNVPWRRASIADIGGNTGFFTIELISQGAQSAFYIEGNREHADFVGEAVEVLGWQNRITILPQYLDFSDDLSPFNVDVCLLLNVLHHIGDDFGDSTKSIDAAKVRILEILARLARHTRFLVFQFGFNWKGDTRLPLFSNGTKQELIDFVQAGTRGIWNIRQIGIAEKSDTGIAYRDLNLGNVRRDDTLGEFLNRPLFIMEARGS